ncbi:beta-xylosidase 2 [Artemisia annua]|uniref:Beta-xylosidase 2 n=1 Tax=Artemisia annua TaxID=35608 RepID=A0A2U1LJE7_ARTAN|nr:beta-xylosidase 2 [Artemisia annua]
MSQDIVARQQQKLRPECDGRNLTSQGLAGVIRGDQPTYCSNVPGTTSVAQTRYTRFIKGCLFDVSVQGFLFVVGYGAKKWSKVPRQEHWSLSPYLRIAKDELLYEQVSYSNSKGIKTLRNEGADLEVIIHDVQQATSVTYLQPIKISSSSSTNRGPKETLNELTSITRVQYNQILGMVKWIKLSSGQKISVHASGQSLCGIESRQHGLLINFNFDESTNEALVSLFLFQDGLLYYMISKHGEYLVASSLGCSKFGTVKRFKQDSHPVVTNHTPNAIDRIASANGVVLEPRIQNFDQVGNCFGSVNTVDTSRSMYAITKIIKPIEYSISKLKELRVILVTFLVLRRYGCSPTSRLLIMGLDQLIGTEYLDRDGLLFPVYQQELVTKVAKASKGLTILVLMSGGLIDVFFAEKDPRIGAIIWVGYPGKTGSTAVAYVLFGTRNPGGKLPMTWYKQDHLSKRRSLNSMVPMTTMDMRSNKASGYPGQAWILHRSI